MDWTEADHSRVELAEAMEGSRPTQQPVMSRRAAIGGRSVMLPNRYWRDKELLRDLVDGLPSADHDEDVFLRNRRCPDE